MSSTGRVTGAVDSGKRGRHPPTRSDVMALSSTDTCTSQYAEIDESAAGALRAPTTYGHPEECWQPCSSPAGGPRRPVIRGQDGARRRSARLGPRRAPSSWGPAADASNLRGQPRLLESPGIRRRSEADWRRTYLQLVPVALKDIDVIHKPSARRVVFVYTANTSRSQLAAA